jgi:hypothetical protein
MSIGAGCSLTSAISVSQGVAVPSIMNRPRGIAKVSESRRHAGLFRAANYHGRAAFRVSKIAILTLSAL